MSLPSAKKYVTNLSKAERCNAQLPVCTALIYQHITATICIYCLIASLGDVTQISSSSQVPHAIQDEDF